MVGEPSLCWPRIDFIKFRQAVGADRGMCFIVQNWRAWPFMRGFERCYRCRWITCKVGAVLRLRVRYEVPDGRVH